MKGIILAVLVILLGVLGWVYLKPMLLDKSTTTSSSTKTQTTTSKTTETVSSENTIEIKNFAYSPATLTVKAGEKVTVTNMDLAGHSVTADDGSFDTGILSQNENGSFTAPTKPGTYTFHCTPHPSITGTLIVN